MRDYSKFAPQFWTGDTGRKLAESGTETQLMACYLITCPNANPIGLYHLSLGTICDHTGLSAEGASKALARVYEAGFATYDETAKLVWVPEMARIQIGESLSHKDLRVKWVKKEISKYRKSRFYKAFMKRYAVAYGIIETSPLEAPSKPLRSQEREMEREMEQEKEKKRRVFLKPSIEEIKAYCLERNNAVDPVAFFDFYESKGWKVGPNAMKNWQAAIRTWERRSKPLETKAKVVTPEQMKTWNPTTGVASG